MPKDPQVPRQQASDPGLEHGSSQRSNHSALWTIPGKGIFMALWAVSFSFCIFWRASSYPLKLHPFSSFQRTNFSLWPGIWNASSLWHSSQFCGFLSILWATEQQGWESAWSLPARDSICRTTPLVECSQQWPVRKCHWPQGCTQKRLFQPGGCLNMKTLELIFLSFLQEILPEFENQLSGRNV